MIDNQLDKPNIKLTPEQTQAIETSQQRLTIIQIEIANTTKALNALKNDSSIALKDANYQKEILANINIQIAQANETLDALKKSIVKNQSIESDLREEIETNTKIQTEKEMSLKDREVTIEKKENDIKNKELALNQLVANHAKEYFNFSTKVVNLKEVLKDF